MGQSSILSLYSTNDLRVFININFCKSLIFHIPLKKWPSVDAFSFISCMMSSKDFQSTPFQMISYTFSYFMTITHGWICPSHTLTTNLFFSVQEHGPDFTRYSTQIYYLIHWGLTAAELIAKVCGGGGVLLICVSKKKKENNKLPS